MVNNPEVPKLLLTQPEAAEALAVSPRTLWSLTRVGKVICLRIGGLVRYDPRDLQAFIESQKANAATDDMEARKNTEIGE